MEGMSRIISDIANFIGEMFGNMWFAVPAVGVLIVYLVWIRKKR